jgi:hypothetical protein
VNGRRAGDEAVIEPRGRDGCGDHLGGPPIIERWATALTKFVNKGREIRRRKYTPIPVEISCRKVARHDGSVAVFSAYRSNGELQNLDLNTAEVERALPVLLSCSSKAAKETLLQGLLDELSDAKLLRALADRLAKRKRLP